MDCRLKFGCVCYSILFIYSIYTISYTSQCNTTTFSKNIEKNLKYIETNQLRLQELAERTITVTILKKVKKIQKEFEMPLEQQ